MKFYLKKTSYALHVGDTCPAGYYPIDIPKATREDIEELFMNSNTYSEFIIKLGEKYSTLQKIYSGKIFDDHDSNNTVIVIMSYRTKYGQSIKFNTNEVKFEIVSKPITSDYIDKVVFIGNTADATKIQHMIKGLSSYTDIFSTIARLLAVSGYTILKQSIGDITVRWHDRTEAKAIYRAILSERSSNHVLMCNLNEFKVYVRSSDSENMDNYTRIDIPNIVSINKVVKIINKSTNYFDLFNDFTNLVNMKIKPLRDKYLFELGSEKYAIEYSKYDDMVNMANMIVSTQYKDYKAYIKCLKYEYVATTVDTLETSDNHIFISFPISITEEVAGLCEKYNTYGELFKALSDKIFLTSKVIPTKYVSDNGLEVDYYNANDGANMLALLLLEHDRTKKSSRDRIAYHEWCMEFAKLSAKRSTCLNKQVGAAIFKDHQIISTGYNGAPTNVSHCRECIRKCDSIESGTRLEYCMASHAEQNAIAQAAKLGISTSGAIIYITHSPCTNCLKSIVNSGIVTIVFDKDYPMSDIDKLIVEESDITITKLSDLLLNDKTPMGI